MSSFSYPPYNPTPSPPKQYPTAHSMSSAFSPSANPNEDWTKISDLAERRRIQNRIAQRNYRKKLKKRLEDLERRAGSSSASPEQQPAELPSSIERPTQRTRGSSMLESSTRSTSQTSSQSRTPELVAQSYVVTTDDRSMFSQQSTRQLSTSPPPFTYNTMPLADSSSFQMSQMGGYYMPNHSMYGQYMPQQGYSTSISTFQSGPGKTEQYGDDEISPFSMSYASIAGIDVPAHQAYSDVAPYTPSLLDSLDFGQPDSPTEDLLCPKTPTTSFSQCVPLYL